MCDDIRNAGTGEDTEKTRDHEAVVQDVLADARRAGTVKADAGQVGRVGRQEEVAVAGRDEGHDQHRIHADIECQRHDDRDGRSLRVNELRREECAECIECRDT